MLKHKLLEALRKSNNRKLETIWKQVKVGQAVAKQAKQAKA